MQKNLTLSNIESVVCDHYKVSNEYIKQPKRDREIVEKRQMAQCLSTYFCKTSLYNIGQYFGGKDHATVLHSKKTILDLCDSDQRIKEDYEELYQKLHRLNTCFVTITPDEIYNDIRIAFSKYLALKMQQLKMAKVAARDIAQLCDRLTLGNVSNNVNTIKHIAYNLNNKLYERRLSE